MSKQRKQTHITQVLLKEIQATIARLEQKYEIIKAVITNAPSVIMSETLDIQSL